MSLKMHFLHFLHQICVMSAISAAKDLIKIWKWWKTDIRENWVRAWWVTTVGSCKEKWMCSKIQCLKHLWAPWACLFLFLAKLIEICLNATPVSSLRKKTQKTILVANSLNPRYSVSILLLKNIEMATLKNLMCRLKSDFLSKISVKKILSGKQENIWIHQCNQEVLKDVFTVSAWKSVFLCLILGCCFLFCFVFFLISYLSLFEFWFWGCFFFCFCFAHFFADVITF